jgi:hypothetical protein
MAGSAIEPDTVADQHLPEWWAYPEHCEDGHPWRPGSVIVSWLEDEMISDGGIVLVSCGVAGCAKVWSRS